MTTPRHSVSVAGVVVNDEGRILAIRRRDTGEWQPPGGILELNETIHDGLRREIFEETGVVVAPERLTGVYKNMILGVVALVFRCRRVSGAATVSAESVEVDWLSLDSLRDHMTDAFRVRVIDAIHGTGVAIREHDGRILSGERRSACTEGATNKIGDE